MLGLGEPAPAELKIRMKLLTPQKLNYTSCPSVSRGHWFWDRAPPSKYQTPRYSRSIPSQPSTSTLPTMIKNSTGIYWKKFTYKWTHTVQTCVVQGFNCNCFRKRKSILKSSPMNQDRGNTQAAASWASAMWLWPRGLPSLWLCPFLWKVTSLSALLTPQRAWRKGFDTCSWQSGGGGFIHPRDI